MANVLGRLVVLLGLDHAEYTKGLTKAEYQAQQFARNTKAAIAEVGKVLGAIGIGAAIVESTKAIIAEAAALDDLADSTGATVEALSQLNNQAKIAGTDFATLQNALLKLSQGMAGADDESTKTKEALKILGITAKDPAKALQEVAVALNRYEDGVNKVGLAVALFGKQGAALLPTLKDMAELGDVNATITKKQAEEAEKLEKAWRRLSVESVGFKNAILENVVPYLNQVIAKMRDTIQAAGGFWAALRMGAETSPFTSAAQGAADAAKEVQRLENALGRLSEAQKAGAAGKGLKGQLADAQRQLEFFNNLAAQAADKAEQAFQPSSKKPPAPNPPGGNDQSKALKEQTSDAERLIQTLQKQVVAQRELNAVDTVELDIARLQKDAKSGLTAEREAQLRLLAKEIDAGKEADRVAKELAKSQEAIAKAKEQYAANVRKNVESTEREAAGIRQGNESIREQIIALQGGQTALDDYQAAKREALAVSKEFEAAQLLAAGGSVEEAAAIRDVAKALRETNQAVGELRIAEQMKKDAEAIAKVQEQIFDMAANNLTDFITGTKSAKDALKSFLNDLNRFLINQAFSAIKNQMLGGGAAGTGIFDLIAKMFATGGGASTVGASSAPFAFTPGLEGFASGGVHRGGLAMVGEMGPELVDLPAGARIRPNNQVRTSDVGPRISIVQNIDRNADTRAHRQAALDAFSVAAGAARRR